MLRRIGPLGDRLLTRLVPKVDAAAQTVCRWEYCTNNPGTCLRRRCCSVVGCPGCYFCQSCQPC